MTDGLSVTAGLSLIRMGHLRVPETEDRITVPFRIGGVGFIPDLDIGLPILGRFGILDMLERDGVEIFFKIWTIWMFRGILDVSEVDWRVMEVEIGS